MSSKTATAEPHLLPSPPPSPTPSQTSTERGGYAPDYINEADLTPVPPTANKGKGRMVDSPVESPQSDQDDDDGEYPPDEMETKRIEETLRKWELEERERRRIARESGTSSKYSVRGVTRTASSIWAGLRNQRPRSGAGGGGGHHHVLPDNENEDGLPLEDLDRTPPPSGANTPTLKHGFNTSPLHSTTISNPFENPSHVRNASTTSLNTPDHSTILTESSEPPSMFQGSPAMDRKKKGAPPPQPLGLPRPRTPPPRDDLDQVYIDEPPGQAAAPSTAARGVGQDSDEPEKEGAWWTEWLCGCSEGPDRGGFSQSGRTNPNE